MITTAVELRDLLDEVNEATRRLQRSETIPGDVMVLIDSFESALGASTPSRLEANPYLTSMMWAAAFRAEKALRHDNAAEQRRDVRVALEQFRHALRDIVENQPYDDGSPIRDVLILTVEAIAAPQKSIAELLGVSVRQLQRWLADDAVEPVADDAARIRIVGQIVSQLRHTFTGPGVISWFYRRHPTLGERPVDLLNDPLRYPEVLSAATAARAMTV